jgi:hypothetical protein
MFEKLGILGTIGVAIFTLGVLFTFKGWLKSLVRMSLGLVVSLFGIAIGMINHSPTIALTLFILCIMLFGIGWLSRSWISDPPQSDQ